MIESEARIDQHINDLESPWMIIEPWILTL